MALAVPALAGEATYLKKIVRREPLISTLGPNDQLVVDYRSTGCFHRISYRFVVRGPQPLEVEIFGESDRSGIADKHLGTVKLTESEVRRLDAGIAFYRSDPPGGCTTEDVFRLVWNRDGAAEEEILYDATCQRYSIDDWVMRFTDLVNRLDEAADANNDL